jgi:hypothetical protein
VASKPQKSAADAAARLIAKYGRAAVAKAIKNNAKSAKPASKYPTSNVKVVKKTSQAKKNYYNQGSQNRMYKTTYKETMDDIYQQQRGVEFGDEGYLAGNDARAAVMEMGKRNFKKKVNRPAPAKSKTIRKQDAKRNQIIKRRGK